MNFFRRLSPFAAVRDLRSFLAQRSRHELIFAFLAIGFTWLIIVGFVKDSNIAAPYKRNIQYVHSWPLDRTDDEIRAKQKIDGVEQARRRAEIEKIRAQRQAEFKRLDDQLESMGF